MISTLWLFIILTHTCSGQPGVRYESFRESHRRPDYTTRREYRTREAPSQDPYYHETGSPTFQETGSPTYHETGSPTYQSSHSGYEQKYRSSGASYSHQHSQPQPSRPSVDYGDVFAGRYEQFARPSAPRSPPPRRDGRRIVIRRRPRRLRRHRRLRPPRREVFREGYIGARGGENYFPFMGGYCAGASCSDGGLAAGVANGIGTGSLEAFIRRRRERRNEDVRIYEMYAGGPGV